MAQQLSEYANFELGEAFFTIVYSMVFFEGVPLPNVEDFDFLSPSWRKLANKENKTADDIKKIDETYKSEVRDLADSCILYMSAILQKKEFTFNFEEFKKFIYIVDKEIIPNDSVSLNQYNNGLQNMFTKIANHGESSGDNLIDNKDWAAYIYSLDLDSVHNENNEFTGFQLNGKISAMSYATSYNLLRKDEENMASFKLRQAYKNLFG